MTGPEHYREAERQLRYAKSSESNEPALVAAQLATAHALLAQTPTAVDDTQHKGKALREAARRLRALANSIPEAGRAEYRPGVLRAALALDEWADDADESKGGAEEPAARCAECGDPVNYPTATYCSTRCRNAADRHDVPGVSGE